MCIVNYANGLKLAVKSNGWITRSSRHDGDDAIPLRQVLYV